MTLHSGGAKGTEMTKRIATAMVSAIVVASRISGQQVGEQVRSSGCKRIVFSRPQLPRRQSVTLS